MKVLTNQTLYQCDHCGKRLLSKNGARIHEEKWCRVVLEKRRIEEQANCSHTETDYHYDYMFGEAVMEPKYRYCVDCGKVL